MPGIPNLPRQNLSHTMSSNVTEESGSPSIPVPESCLTTRAAKYTHDLNDWSCLNIHGGIEAQADQKTARSDFDVQFKSPLGSSLHDYSPWRHCPACSTLPLVLLDEKDDQIPAECFIDIDTLDLDKLNHWARPDGHLHNCHMCGILLNLHMYWTGQNSNVWDSRGDIERFTTNPFSGNQSIKTCSRDLFYSDGRYTTQPFFGFEICVEHGEYIRNPSISMNLIKEHR
jgi:hypothetical protein